MQNGGFSRAHFSSFEGLKKLPFDAFCNNAGMICGGVRILEGLALAARGSVRKARVGVDPLQEVKLNQK